MAKKQQKIMCKCPVCKTDFDITEIIKPIKQKAINEFLEKVMGYETGERK